MELVFATNNKHKLQELQSLLPSSIKLKTLEEIGCYEELAETRATLEGNALQKAQYVIDKFNLPCFADDTGLEVEALNGSPGVYSARYAGEEKNPEKNMEKLLFELKDAINRNAQFRTVIALILNGKEYLFEGILPGVITTTKKGDKGFGYDPIFQPSSSSLTLAEIPLADKNKISHRALAVNKLVDFLNSIA